MSYISADKKKNTETTINSNNKPSKIIQTLLSKTYNEGRALLSPAGSSYSDVDVDFWGSAAIERLTKEGIVHGRGEGTFDPGGTVTLAECLKFFLGAANIDVGEPQQSWFVPYINKGIELDLVKEDDDPNTQLTRGDVARLAVGILKLTPTRPHKTQFPDVPIGHARFEAIMAAVDNGMMKGNENGTFAPNNTINRAEIAQVTVNIMDGGSKAKSTSEPVDAMEQFKTPVVRQPDGSILAHGIFLGPFCGQHEGRDRADIIVEKLASVSSSEYRGAKADGNKVRFGSDKDFTVTDEDSTAQNATSATEAAKMQAGLLDGTWTRGAYKESGRRVLPPFLGGTALYDFVKAVAEGPGRTTVEEGPGEVTIVGLRGVQPHGIYDPKNNASDDTVVPLVVDHDGNKRAFKLVATVDPGDYYLGGAHVGDATQRFGHKNTSGNSDLRGAPLLTPLNEGIEAKNESGTVDPFDTLTTTAYKQKDTLIHFATEARFSQGCTMIIDRAENWGALHEQLIALESLNVKDLGDTILKQSATTLASTLQSERNAGADQNRIAKIEALLEMRRLEEVAIARDKGDREAYEQSAGDLGKTPDEQGKIDFDDLANAGNYKALLSMFYRDPDLNVRYVIVDGSKLQTLPETSGS